MDGQVTELSKFVYWGFGLCGTGFFFIVGWVIKIQIELSGKVTYKWIEEKFEKDLKAQMEIMNNTLAEIRNAVVGGIEKPGIISRLRDVEREVELLKK